MESQFLMILAAMIARSYGLDMSVIIYGFLIGGHHLVL